MASSHSSRYALLISNGISKTISDSFSASYYFTVLCLKLQPERKHTPQIILQEPDIFASCDEEKKHDKGAPPVVFDLWGAFINLSVTDTLTFHCYFKFAIHIKFQAFPLSQAQSR